VWAGHGRDLRQALGERHHVLVIEIGAGHVEKAPGLLLDRRDHFRVGMARGDDSDPGGEIKEPVAIDIGDPTTLASLHHKGIGAREAGRHRPGVPGDQRRLGPIGRGGEAVEPHRRHALDGRDLLALAFAVGELAADQQVQQLHKTGVRPAKTIVST